MKNTSLLLASLLALSLVGCASGGGGGTGSGMPPVLTPVVNPNQAGSTTPAIGASNGAAPTSAQVQASVASAGANSLAAGTGVALTASQAEFGTAGTQGVAGLSVGVQLSTDLATDLATFSSPTGIDAGFVLNKTKNAGVVTGLDISGADASTTGSAFSVQTGANTTVNATATGTDALINDTPTSTGNIKVSTVFGSQTYAYTELGSWSNCTANCTGTTGNTTEAFGVFARGEATAASNIPTSGSYTYSGSASSRYVDATGSLTLVNQLLTSTADFTARSLTFNTTGGPANLDVSGTLNYNAGQNLFSGTVNTTGMTGTAAGRFNGPAVQEIGGVMSLSGADGTMVGNFAGKRP